SPTGTGPCETRHIQRDYGDADEHLEEHIHAKVTKRDIDVLALSLVQWVDGVRIDFDFLKDLKREFPDLMIVADGTQYCGTEPFDFEASGIDILGTSAYKWMLAGYGNGFFLVKDGAMEHFDLKGIGNGSVDNDASKRNSITFCKFLEPGHLDSFNFGSLEFAVDFLDDIGLDNVQAQLQKLSKRAMSAFSELDLLQPAIAKRKQHSTIFNVKGDEKLFNKLTEQNVVASPRGGGIRLSFHFYNTEEEIDVIATLLKRWASN
ncbi:MAG: aminotransferase class V-fold PLP-dependent enzyme, partial [Bacteroidota bacterium]|nr:aminotransferase class V-fold PLP-dependent enzyme [Bacteroidota bacterium]